MARKPRHVLILGWVLPVLAIAGTDPAGPADPAGSPPSPPADQIAEQVIDRVVAVVRPRHERGERRPIDPSDGVITLGLLRFEAAVALLQAGAPVTGTVEDSVLPSALELAISQRLHLLEAQKLRAFAVEPAELTAAENSLAARAGGNPALDRFLADQGFTRADLRKVLERTLRAARTLDSRVRLKAQVSDTEVRRYYDRHPEEQTVPYEERRPLLREKLFREQYRALAKQETEALRRTADVRILMALPSIAPETDGQEPAP